MHRLLIALSLPLLCLPRVAFADVNGSVLVQSGMALNLETGAVSSSGGDMLWNGTTLAPQAGAKIGGPIHLGATDFAGSTQSFWAGYQDLANSNSIAAAKLTPGEVVVAVTAAGDLAAAFIASNSNGALWFIFKTFGASGAAGVPAVGGILNNSSGIAPLFPNYGIAPSSIFIVTGNNLSDPGQPALQSSAPPGIPQTLNGTSIAVTVNGVTTHPALYYTSPGQVAAVLPAATPAGTGTLILTYRGNASNPAPIVVVPSAVGINFFLSNSGVATDAITGSILTFSNSGTPSEIITLWTTGLGADPADSDTTYTASPHALSTPLQIYIGGLQATILYQGASTFPGVNQINVTIPASVPTGCWVSVVAQTGSIVSNSVTLPIHNGGGNCVDAVTGLTGSQVYPPQGQSLTGGSLILGRSTMTASNGTQTVSDTTDGAFERYTGLNSPGQLVSPGSCVIDPIVPNAPSSVTGKDAGTITLTGPNGLNVVLGHQAVPGAFFSNLASTAIPTSGGAFTFTGSGGADIGPLSVTLNLASPLLSVTTAPPAAVDRAQGLPVSWTGGNPGTFVAVTGTSDSLTLGTIGGFTCEVPVELGQFTIPPYILLALPPGKGGAALQDDIWVSFSALGLDYGLAGAAIYFHPGAVTFN